MARREGFTSGSPGSVPGGSGSSTQGVVGQAQDKVTGVVETVQDTAGQVADKVQEKAGPVLDQAQEKASQVADQAKQQVTSRLDDQKERAADGLRTVAQALRQTGQELRGQEQVGIAGYADSAAEQVERFSSYLRTTDANQIVAQVESYARRQPTLFAGGAFGLGLILARFFRSSGQRPPPMPSPSRPAVTTAPYRAPMPTPRPAGTPGGAAPMPSPTGGMPSGSGRVAPAERHIPASPDWTPSSPDRPSSPPGSRSTFSGSERATPLPGSLNPAGTTPPSSPASSGSGAGDASSPLVHPNPSTGDAGQGREGTATNPGGPRTEGEQRGR